MGVELSIVIPAFNEENSIESTFHELHAVLPSLNVSYEIIFVDDGSSDRTVEVIKKLPDVQLIQHFENRGYGAALKSGIETAKGEYILITDADGTYPHEQIPNLWQYAHTFDMVVGARIGKNVQIPLIRKPAKWFLKILANYLTKKKIPDLNSGMRIFKKNDAIKFFNIICDGFSFTTTITISYLSKGFHIKYVPISYHDRVGKSKIKPIKDGVNFIYLIISTVLYFNPMRIFFPLGVLFFLSALCVFIYSSIFLGKMLDTTIAIFVLGGTQTIFFGLLADLIVNKVGQN
jgi:glycosyltransferase involved in cell wall biosynthesis